MIPDQNLQDRVYELLINRKDQQRFLGQKYNAASNFHNPIEQNSTQYVTEIIASTLAQDPRSISSRIDTFSILKQTGYRPTRLISDSLKTSFLATALAPKSIVINPTENPYSKNYMISEFNTELALREYLIRLNLLKIENIHEVILPIENRLKKEVKNNSTTGGH